MVGFEFLHVWALFGYLEEVDVEGLIGQSLIAVVGTAQKDSYFDNKKSALLWNDGKWHANGM